VDTFNEIELKQIKTATFQFLDITSGVGSIPGCVTKYSFAAKSIMSPKRLVVYRATFQTGKRKASRTLETDEQREARLETVRVRTTRSG